MEEFYNKITKWLFPLGYDIVYANHPVAPIREWHFAKEGVRVICVKETIVEYAYLHIDIFDTNPILSIKTGKVLIGTDICTIHKYLKEKANLIIDK